MNYLGNTRVINNGLNFNGNFTINDVADGYWGPNFLLQPPYDNTADVSYALFDTNDEDFAIGELRLMTGQVPTPEPGTLCLVAPSVLGLAGVMRRRLARKSQEVL